MGQGHLQIWEQIQEAQIVAVCDEYLLSAKQTGEKLGVPHFTRVQEMLGAGILDAVDICTPSGLHGDQALLAAHANCHILCEKPLDLNIEKVDRLLSLCQQRALTLACVLQQRTTRTVQIVHDAIVSGKFGRLLSGSASVKWWRSQEYYDSSAWRGTWAYDGGVLANQAIHTLDLLCHFMGRVEEVEFAHIETASHTMEAEDNALAVLRFENGARGVVEATTCSYPDLCARVEIVGTEGSVAFDSTKVVRFGYGGQERMDTLEGNTGEVGGGRVNPMSISLQGHLLIMEDFVEAIRDKRPPLIGGEEARISLDALTKIYRKARPDLVLGL